MSQKVAERWLQRVLLSLAFVLSLVRFAFLRADFPNHSPWWIDQSKFTDEGWWASGAVRHFLLGHWSVAGDYNPAVVVPVWPLLLTAVFHLTGVSIVAERALSVSCSVATVALVYLLVRKYADETTGALAALLLAASPFAFAFSRLATLDTVTIFEFCALLWLASCVRRERVWPQASMGLVILILLLTKTTAVVLLPAVFWLLWASLSKEPRRFWSSFLMAGAGVAAALGTYLAVVLRSGYAGEYRYFFRINALANVTWSRTGSYLQQLLHHGMWIDPILYPVGLVSLVISLVWMRQLWQNPLFVAAFLAYAGDALYILRRQDDYAPRYFLAMLVPFIVMLVLTLRELRLRHRSLSGLLVAALGIALVLDISRVIDFLSHRQYQFYNAAQSIRAIIDEDQNTNRLMLGVSGDQLALMMGIPSLNDGYSSQDLGRKVAYYHPGWYVGWNELDQDVLDSLSAYRLEKVAVFEVFDNHLRNFLTLYRMVPITGAE